MLEVASLCCSFGAFGLFYLSRATAAPRNRARRRTSGQDQRAERRRRMDQRLHRLAGGLALALAWLLWASAQGPAAACLVLPIALMASAVVQVVGRELWPSAMRRLQWLWSPLAGVLAIMEWVGG